MSRLRPPLPLSGIDPQTRAAMAMGKKRRRPYVKLTGRAAIGRSSRRKGNSFENSVAIALREKLGVPKEECCRTPSSGALIERSDLRFSARVRAVFPWFIECKNRKGWHLEGFARAKWPVWAWFLDAEKKALKDVSYHGQSIPPVLMLLDQRGTMTLVMYRASLSLITADQPKPDFWMRVRSRYGTFSFIPFDYFLEQCVKPISG